ncbi:hypothetical protein [Nakamurella leprariae]|uniref:Uncharacterized protein n=1 Tax=Nakamurella leprariae TaxID=2803911 RepID=A0A938YDX2_9ACTN|nr:hypothetical protein [Nakamurella leprariae]MBM9465978.1 hypothetical protein [Nakamurella leprariae]
MHRRILVVGVEQAVDRQRLRTGGQSEHRLVHLATGRIPVMGRPEADDPAAPQVRRGTGDLGHQVDDLARIGASAFGANLGQELVDSGCPMTSTVTRTMTRTMTRWWPGH